jgi:hypothetical protein
VTLKNRAKALNHWACDGSGKSDASGTIKDCLTAGCVPGLVGYAREQNVAKKQARLDRKLFDDLQADKNRAESAAAKEASREATMVSPGSLTKSCTLAISSSAASRSTNQCAPDRLAFVQQWNSQLDRAIGNVVVEEATLLAFVRKPAFQEMVNTAIEYGAHLGQIYPHVGEKRMRDVVIPAVIDRQDLQLKDFDTKLSKFGGTLVSDGKDDVCKDHLLNYVTVTPDGYRFELSRDVGGISRKSEWVADDLMQQLGALEEGLQEKFQLFQTEQEQQEAEELMVAEHQHAQDYLDVLVKPSQSARNYVQIVTDTPSVNAKAWGLIEDQIPHLLANPCIFHWVRVITNKNKITNSQLIRI